MRATRMIDLTKWCIIRPAYLAPTGKDEILVRFRDKRTAVRWLEDEHGRGWQKYYRVVKVPEILEESNTEEDEQ